MLMDENIPELERDKIEPEFQTPNLPERGRSFLSSAKTTVAEEVKFFFSLPPDQRTAIIGAKVSGLLVAVLGANTASHQMENPLFTSTHDREMLTGAASAIALFGASMILVGHLVHKQEAREHTQEAGPEINDATPRNTVESDLS